MPDRTSFVSNRRPFLTAAACLPLALGGFAATPATLLAQSGTAPAREPTNSQLLEDFMHYTLIDNPALAAEFGQALLDKGLDATEFVKLVDATREGYSKFERAVLQGLRNREVEPVAARLLGLYEQGKLAMVRDPEAIARSIADLTGTQRARSFARQRLKEAGEYATPQLFRALIQRDNALLKAEVRTLLVEMGRQSVVPLCTALRELDPVSQQLVIGVLGDIPYTTSLPFIYDVRATTNNPAVRTASEDAIRKIAGAVSDDVPLADRYYALANDYYSESRSLTAFPGEQNQLWWSYSPSAGLVFLPIDTSVFHEAMSMRLCERALQLDGGHARAISLWIAANFSREIDGPPDYANPAYGPDRRDAMYYAVAAGNAPCQRVLGRALDTNDTPLARRAIAAIERTAGGAALWAGGERRALIEAVRYPSRRVQYEAALALGAAGPREIFDGSDRVVPILGSAIRDAGARYAIVIAGSEKQAPLADALRAAGYTEVRPAADLAGAEQAIADMPGVDLILTDLTTNQTQAVIDAARDRAKLRATPVLALADAGGYRELAQRHLGDPTIRVARAGLSAREIGAAADQLLESAIGGPISADEAAGYKSRAVRVLRDLAVSGNAVLNVGDAAGPLVSALADNRGEMRLAIADVLTYVDIKAAQVALMDAALAASGAEQVAMLDKTAASAKRFGNLLENRQVSALRELVMRGGDEQATAAAALMGALNLPNTELVPLILGSQN